MRDSYVNVGLKWLQNNQFDFEVKIAPNFQLNFLLCKNFKFSKFIVLVEMPLYTEHIHTTIFFLYVCCFCHGSSSKYKETMWTTLYRSILVF